MIPKILIVEDELIVAEDMKQMLQRLGYHVAGIAMDYSNATEIIKNVKPDLAILDINLGGNKSGIDVADFINNQEHSIPIIYASSNSDQDTVTKASKTRPNGFLVKPFQQDDLYASIETAMANFNDRSKSQRNNVLNDSIFVKDEHLYRKLLIEEIKFLKAEGNYTSICVNSKKHLVRGKLKEILDQLDNRFIRVHKSFAINLSKVEATGPSFIIIDEQEIPVGQTYQSALTKLLPKI